MQFSKFADYLLKLESTTKRLEITAILAELLSKIELDDTEASVHLLLGKLGPKFDQIDFAIAEKMMLRVLASAYQAKEIDVQKRFDAIGDLGDVAQELSKDANIKIPSKALSISDVYTTLKEIALYAGTGSQEKKVSKFAELLTKLDPLSSKYVVRIPLGNTRLGFSEITLIEALSWMQTGDKKLKSEIESYYNVYPDIARIAKLFKSGGTSALKEVKFTIGVPINPQLCQRVATAEEAIEKLGGKAGIEIKYDGTRVQLHIDKKQLVKVSADEQLSFFENKQERPLVKTFTRNLEESTYMFPDLIKAAIEQIDAESAVIDGEAVGLDAKTGALIPFKETMQRKRKHEVNEKAAEIPLRYFVFDLIYLNGKALLDEPFEKRREMLKKIIKNGNTITVDDQKITSNPEELIKTFNEAKAKGLEGLVMKRLDSKYEAGGRGYSWVKFKREETGGLEDTIDGVILGYYFGKGARAEFGIGGFLVGVFDKTKDAFVTVCKVGSGPTEEEWQEIKRKVDKVKVKEKPANVELNSKLLEPNVWGRPENVVVIRADEITKTEDQSSGFALRFPRLITFRADKDPKDTTSPKEINSLFEIQEKKRS